MNDFNILTAHYRKQEAMSSRHEEAEEGFPYSNDSPNNPWEDNTDEGEDEVTALHDFIAGGLAGSASVVVGHPFDTIKVS